MRHVNFFEVIALNVEIYCPFEERYYKDFSNWRQFTTSDMYFFTKNESFIFKRNIKAFVSSPPNLLFHPLAYILK